MSIELRFLLLRWSCLLGLSMLSGLVIAQQQNPFDIKKRLNQGSQPSVPSIAESADSQQFLDSIKLIAILDSLRSDSLKRIQRDLLLAAQRKQDSLDRLDSIATVNKDSVLALMDEDSSAIPDLDTLSIDTIIEDPPDDINQDTVIPGDTISQAEDIDSFSLLDQLRGTLIKKDSLLSNSQVVLIFCIILMLFLSALLGLFRNTITKLYRGVSNDNYLRSLVRDYQNNSWVYWSFYIFFFLNLALFIFQLIQENVNFYESAPLLTGLLILIVFIFYFIKHLTLWFLGWVFPLEKETYMYSFMTMIVNSLLGLVLFPLNILLAFGPGSLFSILAWIGVSIIVFLYIFRQLKGLFISARFIVTNRFHFFLYLCTIEIAPLLILGKLLFDKIYF